MVYGIAGIVLAVYAPSWRARVIYAIPTTLVTWQVSNVLKNVFQRPRPDYWVLDPRADLLVLQRARHVRAGGVRAVGLVRLEQHLPRAVRLVLAPLLALWACGIVWSRMALGAHYLTDLVGGILLGITMLALAAAIWSALRARGTAAVGSP